MPNYPFSLDDDSSLYLAVNNLRTRLTSSIDPSTLTIPVITTSGFPTNGFLTILSDPNDITKAEAIRYEGYSPTTFSGTERGAAGTPALAHNTSDNVDLTVVADHHNELKDAIIEIEKFLGVSGTENFVPFAEGGNVILPADLSVQDDLTVSGVSYFIDDVAISGSLHVQNALTVSGGATLCFVTVTGTMLVGGTSEFQDDALFTQDVTVSGCVQVGGPNVSGDPKFIFTSDNGATENFDSVTTTTTPVDIWESPSLSSGHNLLLMRASSAAQSGTTATSVIVGLFGGTEVMYSSSQSTPGTTAPWDGGDLSGMKIVTGDGSTTATLGIKRNSGGGNSDYQVGTRVIASIPLAEMGLTENVDYFHDDFGDSEIFKSVAGFSVPAGYTMNFTVTEPGNYLMFAYAETRAGIEARVQYRLNGVGMNTISESADNVHKSHPFVRPVTLSAGANSADIRFAINNAFGASGYIRRGRIVFIRTDFFDNVSAIWSGSNQSSNSNSFVEYTATTQTHTPNQQEQVFVIGQVAAYTVDTNSTTTFNLRNSTTATDYITDFGGHHEAATGDFGISSPGMIKAVWAMQAISDVSSPEEWQIQFREPTGNADSQTVEEGTLVIWSNSLSAGAPTIDHTLICPEKTTTPCVETDELSVNFDAGVSGTLEVMEGIDTGYITAATGTYSLELTVSGVPVSTGTSGGGAGTITSINVDATGPAVTITGAGGISTITAGNTITVSGGGPGFLGKTVHRGARVSLSSPFSISNASSERVLYDTVEFDTDGFIQGGNEDEFVIPEGVSKVIARASLFWDTDTDTAERQVAIRIGNSDPGVGLATDLRGNTANDFTVQSANTGAISVSPGQKLFVLGRQESGGALDVREFDQTFFEIQVVEDSQSFQIDELTTVSGAFTQSLTISGVPVSTGTGNGFRGALLTTTTGSTISTGGSLQGVAFDTVQYDTDGFFQAASNNSIVVPAGVSFVRMSCSVLWESGADNTRRQLQFYQNGANPAGGAVGAAVNTTDIPSAGSFFQHLSSPIFQVSEGDTLELRAFQTTAGDLDVESNAATWLQIEAF